jgi:hypothetical protein
MFAKRQRFYPGLRRLGLGALAILVAGGILAPEAQGQYRERWEYRQDNQIREIPDFLRNPAYRSSRGNSKKNIHDGNRVAITFFNYGLLGGVGEVRGEWPRGRGESGYYVGDMLPMVGAEIPLDRNGDGIPDTLLQRVTTVRGPRAGADGPPGNPNIFWGMEAMGGFANDGIRETTGERNESPAINVDPGTWPNRWPDQPTWINPTTGRADWNGYFGRGVTNADFESYYWMDDHNDRKLQEGTRFAQYNFRPDATDPNRGGMGIAVKTRGMQWSHFLAQDALFMLYEVYNTSTTTYPRVAVGAVVGGEVGGPGTGNRDMAFFDQANNIAYSWDFTMTGSDGRPVGYFGFSFLESPGNDFDGIDNDGDSDLRRPDGRAMVPAELRGQSNTFTAADFLPRTIMPGDPLILIDPVTFERNIRYMPAQDTTVYSLGRRFDLFPGIELRERQITIRGQLEEIVVTEKNLIDDNLNGLIDEDVNLHFERRRQDVLGNIVTLPSVRYKNWIGFANALVTQRNGANEVIARREPTRADSLQYGLLNPMIDEARDDGIDNDGDWDPLTDDVGSDGVPGTGAPGEGDGVPTPGEPNFDATDVNESDQVGLSSFFYFTPPGAVRMNDDIRLWQTLTPGFFTTNAELDAQQRGGGIDGDFVFGSGYFTFEPGEILRFSVALVFGMDLEQITNNVVSVQEIYDLNYNFARPPDKPTLRAVPGDGVVTLYWDNVAEDSIDPILGRDFQGYKLYRSTDPNFRDPERITDAFGRPALVRPMRQWDLRNGVRGFWPGNLEKSIPNFNQLSPAEQNTALLELMRRNQQLYARVRGVPFYLGDDTGIVHSFVDSTVQNGRAYFYAISAYDFGSPDFYPAETSFSVTVTEDGRYITDRNVVRIVPNPPVLGFERGRVVDNVLHATGPATGDVIIEVLDPRLLTEGTEYTLSFRGQAASADSFRVQAGSQTLVSGERIDRSLGSIFDGMRIQFRNDRARINRDRTRWAGTNYEMFDLFVARLNVQTTSWRVDGVEVPYDYEIRFTDEVSATSLGGFRVGTGSGAPLAVAIPTYFNVYNMTLNRPAEFVYIEGSAGERGKMDRQGETIIIYEMIGGENRPTYALRPLVAADGQTGRTFVNGRAPRGGDLFNLITYKPFSVRDTYTFTTKASAVNQETASELLNRIRVVPNPYVAAAAWEAPLPPTITSGRGERRIDFRYVPADAIIRIYTSRGELVRELRHNGGIDVGTVSWDLRTREDLDVAYGVYFYHVEAPGVGETTGKLAIIK